MPPRPALALPTSRRRFLAQSGLAIGGLAFGSGLLAACGGDGSSSTSESAARLGTGGADADLRIANWPLYIDNLTIPQFEQATGYSVSYSEVIDDNERYFAKIREPLSQGQDIGADLFIPTDWMAARLIELGWILSIDDSNVPNKANLIASQVNPAWDPGRQFSLPWFGGFTSIAYNERLTGREITRLDDLFDPEFKGQVAVFADMQDGIGLCALSSGVDLATATAADIDATLEKVTEAVASGQIRRFVTSDYYDDLLAGNLAITMAYSGDTAQLQVENPDIKFVFPEEGMMSFTDNMLIPVTATPEAKAAAEAWMNFVYDPAVMAQVTAEVQFIPSVAGVGDLLAEIDPELAANPLINPPAEVWDRTTSWRTITDEESADWSARWLALQG